MQHLSSSPTDIRHRAHAWILGLATAVSAMGNTSLGIALTEMAHSLNTTTGQVAWAVTSYSIASALGFVITGWLVLRYGAKNVLFVSTGVFVLSSLWAGLATHLPVLLAARSVQGLAAGPMASVALVLLLEAFPQARAGRAAAAWGAAGLLAPVAGPVLGAWMTDQMSWRWIFILNLPLGAIVLARYGRGQPHDLAPERRPCLDGLALLMLIALVCALAAVPELARVRNGAALGGLAVLVPLVVAALWRHESQRIQPLVDVGFLRDRRYASALLITALTYALYSGHMALLPVWLHSSLGFSVVDVGKTLGLIGVTALIAAPVAGVAMRYIRPQLLLCVAIAMVAGVHWLRATWDTDIAWSSVCFASVLQGLATAFVFVPLTTLTVMGTTGPRAAAASGLYNFVRASAGGLGVAAIVTGWETLSIRQSLRLQAVTGACPSRCVELAESVDRHAAAWSATEMYWLCGLVMALSSLLVCLIPTSNKPVANQLAEETRDCSELRA